MKGEKEFKASEKGLLSPPIYNNSIKPIIFAFHFINMKKIKISILVAIVALFSNCSDKTGSGQIQLKTFKDSLSYSFGTLLAEQIKPQLKDVDIAVVTGAFREALSDTSQLTLEQCQQVYMTFNEKKAKSLGEEGEIYLAENATKEGVKTTASGLQYKILQIGTGDYPTAKSTVRVHYTGTLIDGTVFDSSVERGEPISFPLSGVIPGWTEGLQLINVGGKIELTIPYELGYGERGQGSIPPRSVLIFDVELIAIEA